MTSKLNQLAAKTAQNYAGVSGNKEAALDPATIMTFLQLIMQVIDMFKNCKKPPAAAAEVAKNPGLFYRIRLRGLVRDNMSRADFRDHGEHVIAALLATGKDVKVEDLKEAF